MRSFNIARVIGINLIVTAILLSLSTIAQAADCTQEQQQEKKRYVTTDLNLRSCASRYCEALIVLPPGQVVFAFAERDGWARVNVRSLNVVGYVAPRYLSEECVDGDEMTRQSMPESAERALLIARSKGSYGGSCPCPYNTDRGGRRCGRRSAYSRPGGASPICYDRDITDAMIARFRSDRRS